MYPSVGTAWMGRFTYDSASFVILATTGGRFNNPSPVPAVTIAGSGSVQFTSCTTGTMTYNFNDGRVGTIPLTRVGPAAGPC